MIRAEKLANALYALNGVIVQVRFMASERKSSEDIADILDRAEELPRLIVAVDDRTETFRIALRELANRYADFRFVVDRFEQDAPANW